MTVRVTAGARLHFGFGNLSLAHERLYGGMGVALDAPRVAVEADPADAVRCSDPALRECAERAAAVLDVPGADVRVESALPRHVGLGSGTQHALAAYVAVALANDREPRVRAHAPELGRGGRSGVGIAGFESGGFVLDAGHPTERFTTAPPAQGEWTVPPVAVRRDVPADWRFVLALPEAEPGRSGDDEDSAMRAVVERADPTIATEISRTVTQRLLPALAEGDRAAFGAAVSEIGRLNGAWYADEQGGVYRPPVGAVVDRLQDDDAVAGAGQSSWGPAVYGVTTADRADDAAAAARAALDETDAGGEVRIVGVRNRGARVEA